MNGHKNEGGVLSSIFKAKVQLNGKNVQLFIKTMPSPDQPQRVFIEDYGIDAREVKTYSTLFKQLKEFDETKDNNIVGWEIS